MEASETETVQPQQVLDVLNAVCAGDLTAEGALRGWESDAVPGFFHSLLAIAEQTQNIGEVGPMLVP